MTDDTRAPSTESLTIGQLAAATGVSAKTIRYYEETELLARARRGANGYRVYCQRDVHLLCFIKRARDLGFSVDNVGELVALWNNQGRKSREVKRLARVHLEKIEEKIQQMEALKITLSRLVHHCHGDDQPDCPILDDLATAGGVRSETA